MNEPQTGVTVETERANSTLVCVCGAVSVYSEGPGRVVTEDWETEHLPGCVQAAPKSWGK